MLMMGRVGCAWGGGVDVDAYETDCFAIDKFESQNCFSMCGVGDSDLPCLLLFV